MIDPSDPRLRTARRIEGGPEMGPESTPDLGMAESAAELTYGSSRYAALHDTFGARDDGSSPLDDGTWDDTNIAEFLRTTVGHAKDFMADYESMTDEERKKCFPDPTVAYLVDQWARFGKEGYA